MLTYGMPAIPLSDMTPTEHALNIPGESSSLYMHRSHVGCNTELEHVIASHN